MLRHVLLAALVLAPAVALVPPASACCHILYLREDVGPCYLEWRGDALHMEHEYATVVCAGQTVAYVGALP